MNLEDWDLSLTVQNMESWKNEKIMGPRSFKATTTRKFLSDSRDWNFGLGNSSEQILCLCLVLFKVEGSSGIVQHEKDALKRLLKHGF